MSKIEFVVGGIVRPFGLVLALLLTQIYGTTSGMILENGACPVGQRSVALDECREFRDFVHYLFAQNELGYTLFGDKPLSFCFLPTGLPHIAVRDHAFKLYRRGERSFRRGWSIWKKLQIPEDNYCLIVHEENQHPILAILINKRAVREVFLKNVDSFFKYYDPDVTEQSLLEDLTKKETFYQTLFHEHRILGILLGYGKHNAELFHRRLELSRPTITIPFARDRKPRGELSSIEEEIQFLDERLKPMSAKSHCLLLVTPVRCCVDFTSPETLALKKKYDLTHGRLTAIFKDADWLDLILDRIAKRR